MWIMWCCGRAELTSGGMESSTTHRTTTVKTTTTNSEGDAPAMTYRPSVNARTVVIQRSSYGGGAGGSSKSSSRERSVSYGAGANIPAGAYALVSSSGVTAVKTSREQEKKDMQDLNERFASYIEKVGRACHSLTAHVFRVSTAMLIAELELLTASYEWT